MSLFRTLEWWRTDCGGGEEVFDGQSIVIVPLFGDDKKDIIVVSSHSGFLRLYSPSSKWDQEKTNPTGYQLTDLIIESRIADCIIDVKAGKFVSGSQDLRLGILTPSKLLIYAVTFTPGSTEHGDRCTLEMVYQHELPRFPASLIAGPFGSARGRDFLAVQCLDGTMLFYEQETQTFQQILKDRLLSEQVAYVPRNDVFITSSPGWILECYRYQNMAEFCRRKEERKHNLIETSLNDNDGKDNDSEMWLEPDWIYNLGEAILGIQTVTLSSFEVGIIVLGERNLYCFRDNCTTVKYAKKLDYSPVCFHAYVIEPDGKLMVLVVADTDTLLVYEGATLKWSAQLPFTPVAILRARFQYLEGVIVILSEDGRLEGCYLGAEPSLFVAPPIHSRKFDVKAAQQELLDLRKLSKKATADKITKAVMESEIVIKTTTQVSKDPPQDKNPDNVDSYAFASPSCKINIELSSYSIIRCVEVNLSVVNPLMVTEDYYSFPSLRDRQQIQVKVEVNGTETILSSELRLTVSYETEKGDLRVVEKIIHLPLRILVRICSPENTAAFTTTFKSSDSLVNFSQLFPELMIDYSEKQSSSSGPSNALGLRHINSGHVVTIILGISTNRYRVQSNDALAMTLIVQQLLTRLCSRLNPNSPGTVGTVAATITQNHLQLVQGNIEDHFISRQQVQLISNELALITTQLRNIEKRVLQSIREKNSRSLASSGLSILLESTYQLLLDQLDRLESAQMELKNSAHKLHGSLKLILLLIRSNIQDDKFRLIESAIGFEPQPRDSIDWEEIADVTLAALSRGTLKKPEHESTVKQLNWNELKTTRDLAKLKKRIVQTIDRFNKHSDNSILQEDQ